MARFHSTASFNAASVALLLVAGLMVLSTPMASAGAVFEMKKPILANATDYKVLYANSDLAPGQPGSLVSGAINTGFLATTIPQFIAKLAKCAVVNLHIHPLATEQLYVMQGSIEVGIYSEDNVLRLVNVNTGEGVVIPQGTVHYVRNTGSNVTSLLGLFDHPQAGAVFIPNALNSTPSAVKSGAFKGMPPGGVGDIIFLTQC